MKQTAVEWLEKELKGVYESEYFNLKIKEAKEMEKQQILDAYKQGVAYWNGDEWKLIDIEQYYNETFKKQNNDRTN